MISMMIILYGPWVHIISMVDIQEGKSERVKVFQEKAKVFEKLYPPLKGDLGNYHFWIRVYDAQEVPKYITNAGKYFDETYLKEGYTYAPGFHCDPEQNGNEIVETILVPKVNGDHVKLIFCGKLT